PARAPTAKSGHSGLPIAATVTALVSPAVRQRPKRTRRKHPGSGPRRAGRQGGPSGTVVLNSSVPAVPALPGPFHVWCAEGEERVGEREGEGEKHAGVPPRQPSASATSQGLGPVPSRQRWRSGPFTQTIPHCSAYSSAGAVKSLVVTM